MRVDFPEPEGPIMAVNSPAQNSPLTLYKIVLSPEIEKYIFRKMYNEDQKSRMNLIEIEGKTFQKNAWTCQLLFLVAHFKTLLPSIKTHSCSR